MPKSLLGKPCKIKDYDLALLATFLLFYPINKPQEVAYFLFISKGRSIPISASFQISLCLEVYISVILLVVLPARVWTDFPAFLYKGMEV